MFRALARSRRRRLSPRALALSLSRGASLLPLSSLCPNLLRRRRRPRAGHHRKALHGHDRAVGGGDFLGGGEQARQARCACRRAPPGCASGSAPGARNCARVASALSGTPLLTLHHCRRYCAAAASAAATASAAAATPCATPPPPLFSAPSFFFFLLAPPLRPPLQDVPPILVTPKYYLVSILRGGVYVLATVATEVRARARAASCQRVPGLRAAPRRRLCPTLALAFVRAPSPPPSAAAVRAWMQTAALSVIEFLHRVYDVFHEYFGEVRRTHRPRPFFGCCERPARSARAHIVRALFPLRR